MNSLWKGAREASQKGFTRQTGRVHIWFKHSSLFIMGALLWDLSAHGMRNLEAYAPLNLYYPVL